VEICSGFHIYCSCRVKAKLKKRRKESASFETAFSFSLKHCVRQMLTLLKQCLVVKDLPVYGGRLEIVLLLFILLFRGLLIKFALNEIYDIEGIVSCRPCLHFSFFVSIDTYITGEKL